MHAFSIKAMSLAKREWKSVGDEEEDELNSKKNKNARMRIHIVVKEKQREHDRYLYIEESNGKKIYIKKYALHIEWVCGVFRRANVYQ